MRALLDLSVQVFVDERGRVHVTSSDPKLDAPVHFSPRADSEAEDRLRNAYRAVVGPDPEVIHRQGLRWSEVVHGEGSEHVLLFGQRDGVDLGLAALRESYLREHPDAIVSTTSSLRGVERLVGEISAEESSYDEEPLRLVIAEFLDGPGSGKHFGAEVLRLLRRARSVGWSVLVVVREEEISLEQIPSAAVLRDLTRPVAALFPTGFPPGTTTDLYVNGVRWEESDRWVYRGDAGKTVIAW